MGFQEQKPTTRSLICNGNERARKTHLNMKGCNTKYRRHTDPNGRNDQNEMKR